MTILGKLATLLILSVLAGCVTQKEVEYLQDKTPGIRVFNETEVQDYRLKPKDELYIQIHSLDDASVNMFSGPSTQQMSSVASLQPYGASLVSYTIDREGYLLMPVIGNIFVKDKTVSQVGQMLKDSLQSILSQPDVTVKLVNRYISVLGEVRNPGHFAYAKEKLSVYDAIGMAGDITDYGNKSEVILTRNEDGKNSRIVLDLTKSGILSSEYYYLKPNDMIYIKPLKKKTWGMREFPFSIVLSTISTVLLIYTVVK